MNTIRGEYPRPQFVRREWQSLNGEWQFAFDDGDKGMNEQWYKEAFPESKKIVVPFAYQSAKSGIGDPKFHDIVWYKKEFEVPAAWSEKELIVHFGAVDYRATVYINGEMVGFHEGGHVSFSFNISHVVNAGAVNDIVVRAEDPSEDVTIPRGKQYWHEQSASIFYTRTTGIWQSVWLEPVESKRIQSVRWTPQLDRGDIDLEAEFTGDLQDETVLEVLISFKGKTVVKETIQIFEPYLKRSINLRNRMTDRSNIHGPGWYWSPEHPNLFDVELKLLDRSAVTDRVESYFGMRKVSTENGKFRLNNHTYYQKLVLDQGYFRDGLLTAPSDEALKQDILLAKEMGFNGARKHQKVEDPRYLYWADQLGFLVWGEMANCSEYSEEAARRLTTEWSEVVKRDYNHPSIVVWLPLNESWGISRVAHDRQQQHHSLAIYYLTKSLDTTRPVLSNDGWEHTISDICGIHNYQSAEKLSEAYETTESALATTPADRVIYANGYHYEGEPIMITEYGGIAYQMDEAQGWGYSTVRSGDELVEEYKKQTQALFHSPVIQGFCYTQLTDVEQEINGLLTYDRQPKCDLMKIKEINDNR